MDLNSLRGSSVDGKAWSAAERLKDLIGFYADGQGGLLCSADSIKWIG